MFMKDSEILSKYRKAENKKEILGILADLNGCNNESMKQFLLDNGIPESDFRAKRGRKAKMKKDEEKNVDETISDEQANLEKIKIKVCDEIIEKPDLTEDEQKQLDRALEIPMPVRKVITERIESLTEKVKEIERERDCLCDFLEGRVTQYEGS